MSDMHHRKRGARMPWCGIVSYPGLPSVVRFGTVYTPDHDPDMARRLLNEAAARCMPPGFTIGGIERGALIFQPWEKE